MILSEFLELATRAHYWTSHTPEVRGKQYVNDYSAELEDDLLKLWTEAFEQKFPADKVKAIIDGYEAKYKNYFRGWMHAKSNCFSIMITGGSGFNNRKHARNNAREQSAHDKFREWRDKALKGITKSFKPAVTVDSEVVRYQTKLDELVKLQLSMKLANQIIRKAAPDMVERLLGFGFTAEAVKLMITPDFMGRVGFPGYALSNNNAMIKDTELRLAKAKGRKESVDKGEDKTEFLVGDVRVLLNKEMDRLQIFYPGKPEADTIKALKGAAFKWAPSVGAWQRQLTNNALEAAKRLIPGLCPQ